MFELVLILMLAGPAQSGAPGGPLASPAPVSPTPTPLQLPSAPSDLSLEFAYVSRGARFEPGIWVRWKASQPGSFLLKGYQVYVGEGAADPQSPVAATLAVPAFAATEYFYAGVQTGRTYAFGVEAVDVKGNSSPRSASARLDLQALDPSLLTPLAPQGLTATSRRDSVRLEWQPSLPRPDPISGYEIWRGAPGAQAALLTFSAANAFEDLSPPAGVRFSYQVAALDVFGRRSPLSLSVTAMATGPVAPSPPRLSGSAKVEKVSLAWEPSLPGTAPLSAYLLVRVAEAPPAEERKTFKPLEPSRTSFSESVEGERTYTYELRAVDMEGNTSEPSRIRLEVPGKPFNKTNLLLMPTAYSNLPDDDRGFTVNVLFDFYVGSLYASYLNPKTGKSSSGLLQPLQIGTVSGDLKWSLLGETRFSPALAVGLYTSALVGFGNQTVGLSSAGGSITTLGDLYAVVSKRLGHPRAAVHLGAMRGKIADDLAALAPKDWQLTLRHLTPSADFPSLLTRFLDPKLGAQVRGSPHMLFGGLQFPAVVPLGFMRWKTGLKVEALVPFLPEIPHPTGEPEERVRELLPTMVNVHIDNLPLFGFEFSIYRFQNGWQWIAFYHITDLTWSW